MSKAVIFEKIANNIALITINRPEARNSINDEVTLRMEELVDQTEKDPSIRVVILRGAGEKAFCAGADLKMIAAGEGAKLNSKKNGFGGFVYAKRSKPWIAAVNGFALAGGTELCLACDLIIATKDSKFGLPEVKRGLVAGAGGLFRLPLALPQKIATEIILTGNHFSADFAHKYGLVNKVVENDELMDAALKLAHDIALNSPNSIAQSLRYLHDINGRSETEMVDSLNQLFLDVLKSKDALEGTMAFVEKRAPKWD